MNRILVASDLSARSDRALERAMELARRLDLPVTLLHVVDEALLFGQLLEEAGLGTKVDVYPGLPHGFWASCPDLDVSEEWLRKLIDGLRWMIA